MTKICQNRDFLFKTTVVVEVCEDADNIDFRRFIAGALVATPLRITRLRVNFYDFQSPCLLQYSLAVIFAASVLKTASGLSPGLRNFLYDIPLARISIHSIR